MMSRLHSFALMTLAACGASSPLVEEHAAVEEVAPEEEPALTATVSCEGAEEVIVAALSQEEMQVLAGELTLAEAATPALLVTRSMPRLRGRRFFVYEDANDLGVGQRCTAVPGEDDDHHPLMLRVNGPRDASGTREYHEVLAEDEIVVTGGGAEGPGFGSAYGDAMFLEHRLVQADADRRIYATGVVRRHLACRPQDRRAECPNGGTASCMAMAPAVISSAVAPNHMTGIAGVGTASSSTLCRATCEETQCEEALGDERHRAIRQVYEADAPTIAIFRSRGACRAYARERAPLLPRIAAANGVCDCDRCERVEGEDCLMQCEVACEQRNQAILDAAPELEAPAITQLFALTLSEMEAAAPVHRAAARELIEGYRDCARATLEANGTQAPFVAWHTIRWTVGADGRIAHSLVGDEVPETLGHELDACLASTEGTMPVAAATSFAIRVRMVMGASAE